MEEAEMVYTECILDYICDTIFQERSDLELYWCPELAEGEPRDVAE